MEYFGSLVNISSHHLLNKSLVNHSLHTNIREMRNELQLGCDSNYGCFMRYSIIWTMALCIAYLFVFFIGLIGNMSVLWIIITLRRTHNLSVFNTCNKVFNGLIGNLAFADLLVVIFCLPPTLIGNIFSRKLCTV
jgi:hypothetical protein